jgi:hypothetical protein
MAASVYDAMNADKVDDRHAVGAGASVTARARKLVATNDNGRLPNNIIDKAPDANRLDGISAEGFASATHTHSLEDHQGDKCTVDDRAGTISISNNPSNGEVHIFCNKIPPTVTTTQDLQSGTIPADTFVRIEDVVATGTTTNSQRGWVQSGTGQNSGVMVHPRGNAMPPLGTHLHVEGILQEVAGVTTITDAQMTVPISGDPVPQPTVRTPTQLASAGEPYESVLVVVNAVIVTAATSSEFTVTDGASTLVIDDLAYDWTAPSVGSQYSSITGVLYQEGGVYKLEPRSSADLVQS